MKTLADYTRKSCSRIPRQYQKNPNFVSSTSPHHVRAVPVTIAYTRLPFLRTGSYAFGFCHQGRHSWIIALESNCPAIISKKWGFKGLLLAQVPTLQSWKQLVLPGSELATHCSPAPTIRGEPSSLPGSQTWRLLFHTTAGTRSSAQSLLA